MARANTDTLWAETADAGEGLAASLDATLRDQARRNELSMAYVRCLALVATVIVDTLAAASPTRIGGLTLVPAKNAIASGVWLVGAIALLLALRAGWYRPWLRIALPITDAIGMTALFLLLHSTIGNTHIPGGVALLANMTAVCSILAVSGGLRLFRGAVTVAVVCALAVIVIVGITLEEGIVTIIYLSCMVAGVGLVGMLMSIVTKRTARAEVENVILHRLLPATAPERDDDDPLGLITTPRAIEATVLVTDLRGFTARAETLSPAELLDFLNQFQGALAATVRRNNGIVDKFMGDGMLAVFGARDGDTDHATDAVRAAREMLVEIAKINVTRPDGEEIRIGIGVHSGDVVIGCLGSGARLELTVVGDTVNTAHRLEGHTKDRAAPLLVSEETLRRVTDVSSSEGFEPVGALPIYGRAQPLRAHALNTAPTTCY